MTVQHRPETSFTSTRYRLQHTSGKFLHLSGKGLAPAEDYAWCGTPAQAQGLVSDNPDYKLVERRDWRKPRDILA